MKENGQIVIEALTESEMFAVRSHRWQVSDVRQNQPFRDIVLSPKVRENADTPKASSAIPEPLLTEALMLQNEIFSATRNGSFALGGFVRALLAEARRIAREEIRETEVRQGIDKLVTGFTLRPKESP